jgi:hypothetical protein
MRPLKSYTVNRQWNGLPQTYRIGMSADQQITQAALRGPAQETFYPEIRR